MRDYPEKDAEIKDLINDLQAHLPNQESGNFLRNTRASLDYFNNAISKFIDNIQFEADLGMVMENQQKVLLPVAIDVMNALMTLKEMISSIGTGRRLISL